MRRTRLAVLQSASPSSLPKAVRTRWRLPVLRVGVWQADEQHTAEPPGGKTRGFLVADGGPMDSRRTSRQGRSANRQEQSWRPPASDGTPDAPDAPDSAPGIATSLLAVRVPRGLLVHQVG